MNDSAKAAMDIGAAWLGSFSSSRYWSANIAPDMNTAHMRDDMMNAIM
ncbi:Uncharacterised protein [uncultured archaeon]|nr:Uncharacterised protein [uncultured archaeon]